MKATRAVVENWATQRGLEPIQIDGIPEGFSFKEPDLQIGQTNHIGKYVVYPPNVELIGYYANSIEELLDIYNKEHGNKANITRA